LIPAASPIVVVGAGAAGLIAAVFARSGGSDVLLLEGTPDGGRKILISGGGRCNVLPAALEPERFVTASSPVLLRRMLRSWPIHEQIAFFERELGIPLNQEESSRKYFPRSNRARDVRDALVARAKRDGVTCQFGSRARSLRKNPVGWRVETDTGGIDARAVVVATGGLSVPATGSDGWGINAARALGHAVRDTYPALTPLIEEPPAHASLSGLSLDVRLRARWRGRTSEAHGGFLFTHRGYSGPAVLDVSHVAVQSRAAGETAAIRVQWTDTTADDWNAVFSSTATGTVLAAIRSRLPERLAERLLEEAGVPTSRRMAELRRSERAALVEQLTSYLLGWNGDEGYRKAEVTGGGVALADVDGRTCESRRQPGLFFCGEVLDAFGPIGGHNFAWAWATGRLAGLGAAAGA
jgi:predicted Rossmann fold flavoprotein